MIVVCWLCESHLSNFLLVCMKEIKLILSVHNFHYKQPVYKELPLRSDIAKQLLDFAAFNMFPWKFILNFLSNYCANLNSDNLESISNFKR